MYVRAEQENMLNHAIDKASRTVQAATQIIRKNTELEKDPESPKNREQVHLERFATLKDEHENLKQTVGLGLLGTRVQERGTKKAQHPKKSRIRLNPGHLSN